jgi:hypothetical protein
VTARDWFLAGARLLGLWLVVDALLSLSAAFPYPLGAPEAGMPVLAMHPAHALVQGLLALGLLLAAPRCLAWLPGETTPRGGLVGAGVLLMGVWLVIAALATLAALLFFPPGTIPWRLYVEPVVALLLGVLLVTGAGGAARALSRE